MNAESWLRTWWHKPKLRGAELEDEERKVSWLELFYDLVFVVVISRLAHHLVAHPDPAGVLEFVVLFVPVWWIWIGGTFYNERFETQDLSYRIFTFLQMLIVAVMAVFAGLGVKEGLEGFTWAYIAARGLTALMFWRGGRHNPVAAPLTQRYLLGFGVSLGLWTLSLFVGGGLGVALRVIGLLLEMYTTLSARSLQARLPRFSASKLPERFGLFVIIVLGESIVGVVNGLAGVEQLDLATFVRFALGLSLSFGLWWLYFDFIGHRAPRRDGITYAYAWSFLHLPLVIGLTAIGAMLDLGVTVENAKLEDGARWILSGGFALVYLCFVALERTLHRESSHPGSARGHEPLRLVTVALALLVPLFPLGLGGVLLTLTALQLGNMLYALRHWGRSAVGHASH